jgi:3-mercaptopyruvate sulfurtransferase SseA
VVEHGAGVEQHLEDHLRRHRRADDQDGGRLDQHGEQDLQGMEARAGLVTVVDVRPPEEYAQGHVGGALNVPLDRLGEQLSGLAPDREVVAYCRGPWC